MWRFRCAHFVPLNFHFHFLFFLSAFVAKLFLREECLFAIENASKKSEGRDSTIDSHNDDNQEIGSVRENDGGTFLVEESSDFYPFLF